MLVCISRTKATIKAILNQAGFPCSYRAGATANKAAKTNNGTRQKAGMDRRFCITSKRAKTGGTNAAVARYANGTDSDPCLARKRLFAAVYIIDVEKPRMEA